VQTSKEKNISYAIYRNSLKVAAGDAVPSPSLSVSLE
jgi:hypothetical protein